MVITDFDRRVLYIRPNSEEFNSAHIRSAATFRPTTFCPTKGSAYKFFKFVREQSCNSVFAKTVVNKCSGQEKPDS
jgi:hypothetical protein